MPCYVTKVTFVFHSALNDLACRLILEKRQRVPTELNLVYWGDFRTGGGGLTSVPLDEETSRKDLGSCGFKICPQ